MQYRASKGETPLTADQIRQKIKQGATRATLRPNRHNDADKTQIIKQRVVFNELIGDGKIDVSNTLPP